MHYRELVHQRHAETLGIVRQAGLLTLEAAEAYANLSFNTFRSRLNAHQQWSLAMTDGQAADLQLSEDTHRYFHKSFHILTQHYTEWMQLSETQMQIAQRNAHEALARLQQWSPRGTEYVVHAMDYAVDAAERSAESLAEASVTITQAMDARIAGALPPTGRATRRKTTRNAS